uniref:N-acetylglucosaminyltransferase n=1 Tax=viral metagenome TaxID=1070528 RepID=A0A6C0JF57_9ZZZZ
MSNFEIETKSNSCIKIIDCFIFYNELDLLNYRLNVLNDIVDFFVIVESTHTFIGKEKPLIFNDNKHLFDKFNEKIIHIVVYDFPFKYPNINIQNNDVWKNENFQRDQIKRGIEQLKLNDEDIIIITDLDEIPNPDTVLKIKNKEISVDIRSLQMDFYYYNLNSKLQYLWNHPKIIEFKTYKELSLSFNGIRHYNNCQAIESGGWHLSYFGDSNYIKNKIENFSHQEYNNDYYTNIEKIESKIKNCIDIYNRKDIQIIKIPIKDNPHLPSEYEKYLTKYILE